MKAQRLIRRVTLDSTLSFFLSYKVNYCYTVALRIKFMSETFLLVFVFLVCFMIQKIFF